MCTVIILYKKIPSFPIVLAGNRDEFLVRRAHPPHLWDIQQQGKRVRILAGKDRKAGGTWFGINPTGMVAGLTNRFTGTRDPKKNSRGELVLQCLGRDSLNDAYHTVSSLKAYRYNPFNLFCLNRKSGFFYTNHPGPRILSPIEQGIHVLTNQGIEDQQDPKRAWILHSLRDCPQDLNTLEPAILRLLRSHGSKGRASPVCVHLEGYGTVSSFLLALGNHRKENRFFFWDGPPCQSLQQNLSSGLAELFRTEASG